MLRLIRTFFGVATLMLAAFYASNAQTPPAPTNAHGPSLTFQTNEFVLFDSKSNRFATVTAILPVSITLEPTHGKWRGELSATYVRPPTNVILASDKLRMTNWHSLVCMRDKQEPSRIVIGLHPDQPDDYVDLIVPVLKETVSGNWYYATDAGLVDSGTLIGSLRK